jgi:hypothetical protein
MPGVLRKLAEHRIDLNEGSKPVKQQLRHFLPNKKQSSRRKSQSFWQLGLSWRFYILTGLPILCRYGRTQMSGACASTTWISTNITWRTRSVYHALTRLLIQWPGQLFCLFLIATQGIIRSCFAWRTRAKHLLSLCLVPTVTWPCRLDSRTLALHISEQFKLVLVCRSVIMQRPMLMMWWSRPEIQLHWLMT